MSVLRHDSRYPCVLRFRLLVEHGRKRCRTLPERIHQIHLSKYSINGSHLDSLLAFEVHIITINASTDILLDEIAAPTIHKGSSLVD